MNAHSSLAEKVAALSGTDRDAILADLSDQELAALEWDWRFWGRPNQIAPDGQWSTWLALAGRGWGKSEAGAQWVRERVRDGARSIALIAETQKDLEEVMIPRILSTHPEKLRPSVRYKPVRLTWPNGAIALGYNGTEPDQLRGPEFDTAWCFVAGTMVATPSGQREISSIKDGEYVLTRSGPKRVMAIGSRLTDVGEVNFSNGQKLIGTPDHPIYNGNGWTIMSDLAIGDMVCAINASHGTVRFGTDTVTDTTSGRSSQAARSERSTFIARSTARNMAQSLMATMSTTMTRTKQTIRQAISLLSLDQIIESCTSCQPLIGVQKSNSSLSVTAADVSYFERSASNLYARNANQGRQSRSERPQKFVFNAEQSSFHGPETYAASVVSTWRPMGRQSVFCLTVEGDREYFANGILVHNCDELAKYRRARELWDMLQFTMRLPNPRVFVSTTPRPIDVLREIMAAPTTVISRGSTMENKSNLSPEFLKTVLDRYQGTRLGRQELDAEILTDVPGALWTREMITHLPRSVLPKMRRIVVAIDPPATSQEKSNEAGIVAAGLGDDDRAYVLADRSGVMTPKEWGTAAVMLYRELEADRIVAEVNQGGEMVEHVVRSVDNHVPFVHVRAARGKYTRAEPISALYARGLIDHVGMFEALEDQMCSYTPDFDRSGGSPDRMDALVWALSDLFPSLVADKPKPVGPKLNGPISAGSLGWMSR